jgi:hypothetical protein
MAVRPLSLPREDEKLEISRLMNWCGSADVSLLIFGGFIIVPACISFAALAAFARRRSSVPWSAKTW